jgi:hypothetical protein
MTLIRQLRQGTANPRERSGWLEGNRRAFDPESVLELARSPDLARKVPPNVRPTRWLRVPPTAGTGCSSNLATGYPILAASPRVSLVPFGPIIVPLSVVWPGAGWRRFELVTTSGPVHVRNLRFLSPTPQAC